MSQPVAFDTCHIPHENSQLHLSHATMNISLPRRLERIVEAKIESGLYHDASEVVGEALRLLDKHDQVHRLQLKQMREAVRVGERQAARGEFAKRSIDQIIADNEQAAKRRRRK